QNVAEQIGSDDHIEPVGMSDEVGAQNIDVILIGFDLGIVFGNRGEALIPEWHSEHDAVRLGCRRHLIPALLSQLEGMAPNALATAAGEDTFLYGEIELGFAVEVATGI